MINDRRNQAVTKKEKSLSVSRNRRRVKKRDRWIYEKGVVFESIFNESKDFSKDELYQLIIFQNIQEAVALPKESSRLT